MMPMDKSGGLPRLSAALADRYRIERELGEGGMATVYLAHDLKHDRQVAIKVLKPELAAVLGAERFVQEIKTTAALQHPNILPLFDSGEADGFLYYVMPYVEGESLRDRLDRERQLGVDEAVALVREVADGLEYAHEHGVVHRDIKPENILIHAGRPMVADFGIALAVSAAAGGRMTETGLSLGTPHYMSPEQATAEKHITARSDIYSLGAVLYEMLSGEPPHTGTSAQQIIMKIVTEEVAPVTKIRKAVPSNVSAAVSKALEKLPADRFESAKAFADALADVHFTTGSASAPAPTAGISVRSWIRYPVSWGVLGMLAVLAMLQLRSLTRRAPEPAVTRIETTLPVDYHHAFDLSRNGRRFVSGVGNDTIYVRDLDDLTPRAIPVRNSFPQLSWNGERIAFLTFPTATLSVISASGGSVTTLLDSVAPNFQWGDDDQIYVFRKGRFGRVRATGGPFEPLNTPITGKNAGVYAILPGGRGAIVYGREPDSTNGLWAITFNGRARRLDVPVIPYDLAGQSIRVLPQGYLTFLQRQSQSASLVRLMVAPFDLKTLRMTGEPAVLVQNVRQVALSDQGTLIYRIAGIRWRGYFGSRGGAVRPVPGLDTALWDSPVVSPNGRQIAWSRMVVFARNNPDNIWIQDVATGTVRPLTFATDNARRNPIGWSPDGSRVFFNLALYSGKGRGPSSYHIMAVKARGEPSSPDTVFSDSTLSYRPSLAPDGRTVVWASGSTVRRGTIGTKGSEEVLRVPSGRVFVESRTMSPDGRWIAYMSTETGQPELYVQPFGRPGPNFEVAGGGEYFWSWSGRSIFVDRSDGDSAGLWEIPLDLQGEHALAPIKVSEDWFWDDVLPGDSVFVGATPQLLNGEAHFVIVQGVLTEIRRLLKGGQ